MRVRFRPFSITHTWVIGSCMLLLFALLNNIDGNVKALDYLLADSYSYLEAGKNFYLHFEVHPIRPLLYPLLIGWPFMLGLSMEVVIYFAIFLNVLCWIALLGVCYKSLRLFTSEKQSFYGSLIISLCFGLTAMVFQPLTEVPFTLVSLTSIYFLLHYQKTPLPKYLIYSLTLFLLAVLIRPGVLYPAIFFLLIGGWKLRHDLSKPIQFWPLFVAIGLLGFQFFKMNQQFQTFKISNIDGITWYTYAGAQVEASERSGKIEETHLKRSKQIRNEQNWKDKNQLANTDLKEKIVNAPFIVSKVISANVLSNLSGKSNAIEALKKRNSSSFFKHLKNFFLILSRLANVFFGIALFVFIPFTLIIKKAQMNFFTWALLIYLFYSILVSGISFWQGDRFSLVCYPVLILFLFYLKNQSKPSSLQQEK